MNSEEVLLVRKLCAFAVFHIHSLTHSRDGDFPCDNSIENFFFVLLCYFEHLPQSAFLVGNFFTFKYFNSFFNFNLRLTKAKINFSIHVKLFSNLV